LKKYKHLFFDLDGTLWDLKKNTIEALTLLFDRYSSELQNINFKKFHQRYVIHNDRVWALYRDGKIEKEKLRYVRFERAFEDVGSAPDKLFIDQFANDFMYECPRMPHTLEGTHELLDYCKNHYELHIITNGFIEVQGHKMNAANLNSYFTHMINSEHCGVRKPHAGIFEYALQQSNATREESLMIGDDWDADILGARDFGMDQAFITTTEDQLNELNEAHGHAAVRHNYKPTYTISKLLELKEVL
jgi:YjjG family noncanonical pyrimidine nucleotidase